MKNIYHLIISIFLVAGLSSCATAPEKLTPANNLTPPKVVEETIKPEPATTENINKPQLSSPLMSRLIGCKFS